MEAIRRVLYLVKVAALPSAAGTLRPKALNSDRLRKVRFCESLPALLFVPDELKKSAPGEAVHRRSQIRKPDGLKTV